MSQVKTTPGDADVDAFLAAIPQASRHDDCREVARMMKRAGGAEPRMWGASIVGFGSYLYRYASGREGEWMLCGFAPRKQNLVIYIMPGFKSYGNLMKKLGKYKTGKSCLYINSLDDIDRDVLQALIESSVSDMRSMYETAP